MNILPLFIKKLKGVNMTSDELHLKILDYFCIAKSNRTKLNPSRTNNSFLEKHYNEICDMLNYLDNYAYDSSISLQEKLFLIQNDLHAPLKCVVCGANVKFLSYADGYARHCCKKCACDDPHNKNSYMSSIRCRQLSKHPELGCDLSCHNDEADYYISKLFILSSGEFDGNKCSHTKRWCQKHKNYVDYIVNRYADSSDISENVYRIINKIDELPRCSVCNGPVKYISFTRGYSNTCSHKCAHNTKEYHQAFESSMNNKYGVNYTLQSDMLKSKCYNTFSERIKSGYYDGGKSDISAYASDKERLVYNTLKPLYPDIVQYYKDERYSNPRNGRRWECDFYIPSIDLFIEVQGFRTHGDHPYNKKCEDDRLVVERLKNEYLSGKYFSKDIIYTWTKVDPYKRYIAKKNNLKYIELFPKDLVKDRIIELVNSV